MSNTFTKFIDSCVGAIARKVQDEFDESKHPRDKGGRFSSKGGEGRGEGGLHHAGKDVEKYGKDLEAKHKETVEKQKARRGASELEETDFEKEAKEELNGKKGNVITTSMEFAGDEKDAEQLAKKYGFDYKLKYPKGSPYAIIEITGDKDALRKYAVSEGFGSEEDAREFAPELFEESEDDEESDSDPVAKMRKHLDDDLFELATSSESEEEFISKAERRIKQDLWAAKSAPEELPVKGQKAEYALKKILSEIKSGTSEYW